VWLELEIEELREDDFTFFVEKMYQISGIWLSASKKELVKSRFRARIQDDFGGSFKQYRLFLEKLPSDHPEWQVFTNLLTTNKTEWFREIRHFQFLANEYLPKLKHSPNQPLKVWSSACSTGEEPYSIAILLKQCMGNPCPFEITATDIDTHVLSIAKKGIYPAEHLNQIPQNFQSGSFQLGSGSISDWMKVHPLLKEKIRFEQFNLISSSCPWKNYFDIIFCRNVLIYFKPEEVLKIVTTLYRAAAPGALLIIGHSESLQRLKTDWKFVSPSIFIKSKDTP
jgi:chemotaxis methyl-accepting protein methylase